MPRRTTGHRQGRDQRRAEIAEEKIHHEEDEYDRLDQRLDNLLDRDPHERRRVERHRVGHALRKERGQLLHPRLHPLGRVERVRPRREPKRHARGRLAVIARDRPVILRADLDPRHVVEQNQTAVGLGPQHDLLEISRRAQKRLRRDRRVQLLAVHRRQRPELPRRDLRVLRRDRALDIRRRQLVGRQPRRVEPDPHRIRRAEHLRAAHALDPADLVDEVRGEIIRQIHLFERPVLGNQRDHHQEAREPLVHGDSLPLDRLGQKRRRLRQLVLHLDLGDVRVRAGLERQRDRRGPRRRRGRRDVAQPVQTRHLLFENLRHRRLDRLRRGARVDGVHRDRRRSDLRILRHRQRHDRERADPHDQDRDDPCEDRPVDEKTCHVRVLSRPLSRRPGRARRLRAPPARPRRPEPRIADPR